MFRPRVGGSRICTSGGGIVSVLSWGGGTSRRVRSRWLLRPHLVGYGVAAVDAVSVVARGGCGILTILTYQYLHSE